MPQDTSRVPSDALFEARALQYIADEANGYERVWIRNGQGPGFMDFSHLLYTVNLHRRVTFGIHLDGEEGKHWRHIDMQITSFICIDRRFSFLGHLYFESGNKTEERLGGRLQRDDTEGHLATRILFVTNYNHRERSGNITLSKRALKAFRGRLDV